MSRTGRRRHGVPAAPRVRCAVWWATPSDQPALVGLLDDDERRRRSRLTAGGARERYVTAHVLLRLLLAEATGVRAADLRFDTTCYRCGADHGKPRLVGAGARAAVGFNVSHAEGRVAVAVTDGAAVGIDVEPVLEPAADAVAEEILGPTELEAYRALPADARARALAVWWTRKEAVLKATGDGLALAPALVPVSAPDEPAALATAGSGHASPEPALGLHLQDLAPVAGYAACVAVLGPSGLDVSEHDADPLLAG
ncbi:4'-phosphopantetheinyl transferase superfamily protein [Georgenia sp. SYP-B2076]|uniref:4'-phosphopantetheinyl transferase family protein n=1 Tax=Georgenia sp. SYP-B2076 TaxID=2495881 RepID=UPI000F8DB393|nr:4'-phosphopantetheinyl transferase superfamily protein [Georgenia sp. SYP-B2076]